MGRFPLLLSNPVPLNIWNDEVRQLLETNTSRRTSPVMRNILAKLQYIAFARYLSPCHFKPPDPEINNITSEKQLSAIKFVKTPVKQFVGSLFGEKFAVSYQF